MRADDAECLEGSTHQQAAMKKIKKNISGAVASVGASLRHGADVISSEFVGVLQSTPNARSIVCMHHTGKILSRIRTTFHVAERPIRCVAMCCKPKIIALARRCFRWKVFLAKLHAHSLDMSHKCLSQFVAAHLRHGACVRRTVH